MDLSSPMPLAQVIATILDPMFAILPAKMDTHEARVMLLTIGQQESRFMYRRQSGNGPARGFWQFEQGGGVKGVYNWTACHAQLEHLCLLRSVAFGVPAIWAALETDDVLAAGVARLLLSTDAAPLPALDDVDGAWNLYAVRLWRPGKPKRETWDAFHAAAVDAESAEPAAEPATWGNEIRA